MYYKTTAYKKIARLSRRIRAVQGGSSASKTVSIVLWLIAMAQTDKTPTITSIVSESLPHLKRGAMLDFLNILKQHDYYDEERWNKSDFVYTFETGSKIEFFSVDQPAKVRGPRRDRLFMNEANNCDLETFEQLEIRTNEFIFLDWNPTNEFWFYTGILNQRGDVDYIVLTYLDNEALNPAIKDTIELRKNRKGWWQVYGLGQLGEVEGKIYRDWKIIEDIPHEAKLISYGLDFGYTNDPTAIVALYYFNGGYIVDEVAYSKGLLNNNIAELIKGVPTAPVIADSAEPKSIDELRLNGITVVPSTKGKGSVSQRIQFVQQQRMSVTKNSVNVIREYRNYLWETDKDGKILNVPEHRYSHSMDAVSYGLQLRHSTGKDSTYEQPAYQSPSLEEDRSGQPVLEPAITPHRHGTVNSRSVEREFKQPDFESSSL